MWTYEATAAGYSAMWAKMTVTRQLEADTVARKIISYRERYTNVQTATGVPWFWVGVTHYREAGLSFAGVLHNGEQIIGTGRRTSLVPAGRGPFATWEASAVDALTMRSLQNIKQWPVSRCLYEFEVYNGTGYVFRGENSPYVWAGTSLQQSGKYVADGQYDQTAIDKQLGCAAVLSRLCALSVDVRYALAIPLQQPPTPKPPSAPPPAAPKGGFFNALKNFLIFSAKNQKDN